MCRTAFDMARQESGLRYQDHGALAWLWTGAPHRWLGKVTVEFRYVPFHSLQSAASGKNPDVVSRYKRRIVAGNCVAPLVVSATGYGTYYIHDGNHRHEAMRSILASNTRVRVAVAVPRTGFHFRWRWFGTYGTYVLEPEGLCQFRPAKKDAQKRTLLRPLLGTTMMLVAHPDDESGGCASLLQRAREPIVVFATDGAPADEYFWKPYGSRTAYGQIRRSEAKRALSAIGVKKIDFLSDGPGGVPFKDQQLHLALRAAIAAALSLARRHRPDAILVPAYEGGHPDHDACSFIGFALGYLTSLPVWEMPLYHRSRSGELVCQRFRELNGTEIVVKLTESERLNRNTLVASYASQSDLGQFVTSSSEYLRPQQHYDYSKPPHEGSLNYQAWGWPISPEDLCRRFEECAAEFIREGSEYESVEAALAMSAGA
jgi:LmbE family N-acetylglucosaminyl deacetylase